MPRSRPTPRAGRSRARDVAAGRRTGASAGGSTPDTRGHGSRVRRASPRSDRTAPPTMGCPMRQPVRPRASAEPGSGRPRPRAPPAASLSTRPEKRAGSEHHAARPAPVHADEREPLSLAGCGDGAARRASQLDRGHRGLVERGGRGAGADESERNEDEEETTHDDQGCFGALRAQAGEPCVDAILTACVMPLSRGFAVLSTVLGPGGGSGLGTVRSG